MTTYTGGSYRPDPTPPRATPPDTHRPPAPPQTGRTGTYHL